MNGLFVAVVNYTLRSVMLLTFTQLMLAFNKWFSFKRMSIQIETTFMSPKAA